ncbi:hypothetical protein ACFPFV_12915 [Salinicoccus siamensis]
MTSIFIIFYGVIKKYDEYLFEVVGVDHIFDRFFSKSSVKV